MFYIGCPVWGYKGWVGNFFPPSTPQSDFLRVYSKRLNTVEGNTTFYATPSAETIEHWRSETPPDFRFCPKVSRDISHRSRLEDDKSETLFFTNRMRELGDRLGPMFIQFPVGFTPAYLPELEAFLDFWPKDLRLAVEVRNLGFFIEPHASELNNLLRKHNMARVMMDTRPIQVGTEQEKKLLQARDPKPDLPLQIAITTDFAFVRYIGNTSMEVNRPFLDTWAEQFAQWVQQGITPYVFCHCPFTVEAPEICYALYQRISALIPLPPLSWQPGIPDVEIEQGRLF